jgi:hypothetical protein
VRDRRRYLDRRSEWPASCVWVLLDAANVPGAAVAGELLGGGGVFLSRDPCRAPTIILAVCVGVP